KVDVDDVLVAGQHQGLFRHLAGRCATARTLGVAIADLGPVDAGHARLEHPLDRRRQMVIQAGLGRSVVGTKAQHHPDLIGIDGIDPARHPGADDDERPERYPAPAAKTARRQHTSETILAAAQHLLEIGRLGAAAPRARPTAIAAVAAAPRTATARAAAPRATALT